MPDANAASALLIYGPLGIFVALFAFGFIYSKSSMERERVLTDRALQNNAELSGALDRLTNTVLKDRAGA